MWEICGDLGQLYLKGVVDNWQNMGESMRYHAGDKIVRTSYVEFSGVTKDGQTVVSTKGGSLYRLIGPSRSDAIAMARAL
jgi:hypothetical protein